MIYRHIRTNVLYRMLFPAFNVLTQRQDIVYMSLDTGVIFTKDAERFHNGMEYVESPQEDVTPDPNQAEFEFGE